MNIAKKSILFAFLLVDLTAVIVFFAINPFHFSYTRNEVPAQESVEQNAEPVVAEPDDTQVEEEPVIETAPALGTVSCNNNVPCFESAVSLNREANYSGTGVAEVIPGVTITTSEDWTFAPSDNGSYELVIVSEKMDLNFLEGWYKESVESNLADPATKQIYDELNATEYPTEEERAEMDEDARTRIEEQMKTGKPATDFAWELAEYTTNNYMYSIIMGSRLTTSTCDSTDEAALLNTLKGLKSSPLFLTAEMPFLACEVEYGL